MMKPKMITPEVAAVVRSILSHWTLWAVAHATGVKASQNVNKWRYQGNIPAKFRLSVLGLAIEGSVDLTPTERAYLESEAVVPLMADLNRRAFEISSSLTIGRRALEAVP